MAAPPTEFDFGVLRQQNVLAFYVAVDDVVGVQVGQTLEEEEDGERDESGAVDGGRRGRRRRSLTLRISLEM